MKQRKIKFIAKISSEVCNHELTQRRKLWQKMKNLTFRPEYSAWAYLILLGLIVLFGWAIYLIITVTPRDNIISIISLVIVCIVFGMILSFFIFLLLIYDALQAQRRWALSHLWTYALKN